MLKIYIAKRSLYYSTDVKFPDGSTKRITFSGGVSFPDRRNGIFTTKNKEIQDAIENDSGFGIDFELEMKEEPITIESEDGKKIIDEVKRIQDAKDVLSGEPYNVPLSNLNNKTAVLKAAEENNLVFPNLR